MGSGLVGALVGGVFALLGVMLAAHFAKRHAEAARRKLVLGGVRAITAELAVNFARYEAMAAPAIRRVADGERMNFHWPITSEYFAVYAANAGLLGELDDDDLAKEIIEVVTAAKGLVDSLRLNVQMLGELVAVMARQTEPPDPGLAAEIAARDRNLIAYAVGIRELDVRLSEGVASVTEKVAALK